MDNVEKVYRITLKRVRICSNHAHLGELFIMICMALSGL